MKRKALSGRNRPAQLGLNSLLLWALLFDKFGIPDWAWGAYALFAAFIIFANLYDIFVNSETVTLK